MVMVRTLQDKKWEAESDVRTLTEADQIKKTPSRLNAAKTAAKRMVKEQQKVTKMTGKIAKSKPSLKKSKLRKKK